MVAGPVAAFGWQMYAALYQAGLLAKTATIGSFISPISIYLALVLALNGANLDSKAHTQLWAVLRATQGSEGAFNAQTSALMNTMLGGQQQGTALVTFNAVFAKQPLTVKDAYAESMKASYGAQVQQVSGAADINAWANQVTNGLIPEAVPPTLKFKAVLANALYFLGAWEWPFEVKDTTLDHPFLNARGDVVKVAMMQQSWLGTRKVWVGGREPQRPAQFTEGGSFRGVKLPYRGSTISAIALLPNPQRYPNSQVDRALARIDPSKLFRAKAWKNWTEAHPSLQVSLPRFNVSTEQLSLAKALKAMGATAVFGSQDFGRISDDPLLTFSDVLHSTVIKVNEIGTEAAAVTTEILAGSGIHPDITEPFIFNRTFIFIIVDEGPASKQPWTPLFIGTVADPTAGPSP